MGCSLLTRKIEVCNSTFVTSFCMILWYDPILDRLSGEYYFCISLRQFPVYSLMDECRNWETLLAMDGLHAIGHRYWSWYSRLILSFLGGGRGASIVVPELFKNQVSCCRWRAAFAISSGILVPDLDQNWKLSRPYKFDQSPLKQGVDSAVPRHISEWQWRDTSVICLSSHFDDKKSVVTQRERELKVVAVGAKCHGFILSDS